MKYKLELEATVEAESAEAAEHMVFGALACCADDIGTNVVPTKEWYVDVEFTATCTFAVKVNAESAEDAESKAYELVEGEAYGGDGIAGVLDLADNEYDIADLEIDAHHATPVYEDEEDAEPAQPDTTTAVDDDADSAAPTAA
jgi:hypothetical protein